MTIRIVDNKRVEMTDDEWGMYNQIVKSYTDITGKGEDLFIDLFEANDEGILVFLKPPTKRRTSLEVFLFLMALMQHQHLRLMHQQIDQIVAELKNKNKEDK
jgi:hypothetical protein